MAPLERAEKMEINSQRNGRTWQELGELFALEEGDDLKRLFPRGRNGREKTRFLKGSQKRPQMAPLKPACFE